MDTHQIIQANIDNLTQLWHAVSNPFDALHAKPNYAYSHIEDSDWPNRLWLSPTNQHLTSQTLDQIRKQLQSTQKLLRFPYFDTPDAPQQNIPLIEAAGFTCQFEQVGMSLKLDHPYTTHTDLTITRVTTPDHAQQWADVYPHAFNYFIHPKILIAANDVYFYLARSGNQTVGTAVLYIQNHIAGFHCLGIHPDARRQGHAEQIMRHLLNIAIDHDAQYATLQASTLGQNIYQRLGFQSQYTIKNYVLPD